MKEATRSNYGKSSSERVAEIPGENYGPFFGRREIVVAGAIVGSGDGSMHTHSSSFSAFFSSSLSSSPGWLGLARLGSAWLVLAGDDRCR